jgi:predicted membrane protein
MNMLILVIAFILSFIGVLVGAMVGLTSLISGVPFPIIALIIVVVLLWVSLGLHIFAMIYVPRYDMIRKNEEYDKKMNELREVKKNFEEAKERFMIGFLNLKLWERKFKDNEVTNNDEKIDDNGE